MQLYYEGFGNLHGIPQKCFSRLDNRETDCSSGAQTRSVPAFIIPYNNDGFVTLADGTTKWVKWLEKMIRFKYAPDVTSADRDNLMFGDVDSLPSVAPIDTTNDPTDPSDANSPNFVGEWSEESFQQAPAVIHGVIQ